MKLSFSIDVICFLAQSNQPKNFEQIHSFLMRNPDYEQRYSSYKKDGRLILRRILKSLSNSPYFVEATNRKKEQVYSFQLSRIETSLVEQSQLDFIEAANEDKFDMSCNEINQLVSKNYVADGVIEKLPHLNDKQTDILEKIIYALKYHNFVNLSTNRGPCHNLKPTRIKLSNLNIVVEFMHSVTTYVVPLSDISFVDALSPTRSVA